jgi:hypothetical protein
MGTTPPDINWKLWQKILFRFFFTFLLLLSQIAYNPFLNLLGYGYIKQRLLNAHLKGVVSWLDSHFFHIGFIPKQHSIDFSDTHFGVVLFLTTFIIAVIACILWTIFDKKRTNYNRFYYWFSIYLAYYIFLAMIPYAVQKIIPIQAHYPTAPELLTRWGNLRNWEVLFRFMGTSPAFCMFCGWLELIASLLILFNRTRLLGGMLMTMVLVQVVCFNIFYNNNIIMLSGILLLSTLFIIAKALPRLYSIIIALKPVSLAQYRFKFTTPWKKYFMMVICFLPLWKVFIVTKKTWAFYKGTVRNQERQTLYEVTMYQQDNVTIPPLTTDTLRWKYVCLLDYAPNNQKMVKFDMHENQLMYQCKWDTLHKKIVFADEDTARFSYITLSNGDMQLNGNWHGKITNIQLSKMSIDSLTLIKDKFLFMQEDQ